MLYEDMVDILEEYKKYIPSKVVNLEEPIPGTDLTEDRVFLSTLLGGDGLSVAGSSTRCTIHQKHFRVGSASPGWLFACC